MVEALNDHSYACACQELITTKSAGNSREFTKSRVTGTSVPFQLLGYSSPSFTLFESPVAFSGHTEFSWFESTVVAVCFLFVSPVALPAHAQSCSLLLLFPQKSQRHFLPIRLLCCCLFVGCRATFMDNPCLSSLQLDDGHDM
ncbi:hypothetical protein CHARACLAT_025055 [Characodon lateralis]|uniref:Uncharacterized protein n=1 Tax=Characodon lateralis TaxID=208331 RepID=A0ABU7EX44_9TELE|nr:hypothetical protein [Characodon lateralis]